VSGLLGEREPAEEGREGARERVGRGGVVAAPVASRLGLRVESVPDGRVTSMPKGRVGVAARDVVCWPRRPVEEAEGPRGEEYVRVGVPGREEGCGGGVGVRREVRAEVKGWDAVGRDIPG